MGSDLYAGSPSELRASFQLGPDKADFGALVVHGFTGSPFEVRPLGEALARAGLAVEGPTLAGHCGSAEDLKRTGWPDWYLSAEAGLERLRSRCKRVALCGLSVGGLITLELARRHREVSSITCMAAPLWLSPWVHRAVAVARRVEWLNGLVVPKLAGSDISDREARAKNAEAVGQVAFPFASLYSLVDFMTHVRAHLGEVSAPALVVHSRRDHTAPFACMQAITSGLGSTHIEKLVLERSFHVITLDVERALVCKNVTRHVLHHFS